MLFNSYEFIFLFLPLTFFIYFYLNHKRLTQASKAFLLFSSLLFYSWWNLLYLPIIITSMLFNYVIGNALIQTIDTNKNRFSKKSILTFGISTNIALLGYFKYSNFFIQNLNSISNQNFELLDLSLPLAISFFTFQQIAYLVDSYRQETKEYDFLNYAVFVTFFPQLIAGPIVHHSEMMPQFAKLKNRVVNYKNITLGLFIFSIGLFKKVVIADTFSIWATKGFDNDIALNFLESWATSLSYTFQLYFDFSGYTDMAIGLALLFNIRLPINFNSPYKASSIQDFWRRWHITLSRFLRDYVYIPLGGSRKGSLHTSVNLMATFLLGGIWHGAGWTFIFWGFLHGAALIVHRVWSLFNIKIWMPLSWFITFNFINATWVFFRAKEFDDAIRILKGMFSINEIKILSLTQLSLTHIDDGLKVFKWLLAAFIVTIFLKNSSELLQKFSPNLLTLLFSGALFLTSVLSFNKISQFLYFNF
jgi:alginate O-acetyltransferase complex protein AlgI